MNAKIVAGGLLLLVFTSTSGIAQTSIDIPQQTFGLLDAIQQTLAKHPNILLGARQVDISRGVLQQASGQFDTVLGANGQHSRTITPLTKLQQAQAQAAGVTASSQTTESSSYAASVQKEFRNGITIGPQIQVNRLADNLQDLSGLNQSTIAFQVILPLLRGRGHNVVGAQEMSARFTVDATLFQLNHTIAQQLASCAVQYWNVVAAKENLQIFSNSEARGKAYLDDVRTLIDADRVAKGEINQVVANLADRTSSRIQAEQAVLDAQQALALSMGMTTRELRTFPQPIDPLPDWTQSEAPAVTPSLIQSFTDRALQNRGDLLAANEHERAAEVLVPAARNVLRPQLNLGLSLGYSGLLEGTNYGRIFGSPFYNLGGPTATGSLTYSFAPRNNVGRGELAQAEGSYQQAVIQRSDIERTIASNVSSAMIDLASSIARLQKAREAVNAYRVALEGEQEKFRLGISQLVNVLTIEDRLTNALSQALSAQLNYATAIENLRFATGTIVDLNKQTQTLEKSTFLVPPFDWGAK